MKRLILLATVITSLVVVACSSQAAERPQNSMSQQPATHSTVITQHTAAPKPKRVGFFAKLWELEKRKNAAILRALGW